MTAGNVVKEVVKLLKKNNIKINCQTAGLESSEFKIEICGVAEAVIDWWAFSRKHAILSSCYKTT